MDALLAAVLNPTDKTTVGTYYSQAAVVNAHHAINSYFMVLLSAQNPAKEKFIMDSLMAVVLNPVDKAEVGAYYNEYASIEAKLAIDEYFKVLLAAQNPAKAKFIMDALLAAVLNPTDKTTVGTYYSKTAVDKAKVAIDGYFTTLLAAQDPAKAKFIMDTVIAAVLNPVDKTVVVDYYDTRVFLNAQYAVNKYFQYVWALQNPSKAKFVMDSLIAAVKKPTDLGILREYYNSLNNLAAGHLSTPMLNIGFAQSVAIIQEKNELLIGAPNTNGKGAVYEYSGMPIDATHTMPVPTVISPAALVVGDQFGKALVADKDTLVVQSATSLYFFSRVNSSWVENGLKLDLSKVENLDPSLVQNAKLALLSDKLAVALPSAGVVYVVSRTNGVWTHTASLKIPAIEVGKVQFAQSVAIGNGIIAVGSPKAKETEKSKVFIYRYKGQGLWQLEKTYEHERANFGKQIGLLTPYKVPDILTSTPVVGHQLIVALNAIPESYPLSSVFVYNETLSAPYGTPLSIWDVSYSRLNLTWHSTSSIVDIVAKGNTIAVAMHPKTFVLEEGIHTTDSIIVFKRQANSSLPWAYNLAGAGVPNFGAVLAIDGDTVIAGHPEDDNVSTIKSGVVVLSPKGNN